MNCSKFNNINNILYYREAGLRLPSMGRGCYTPNHLAYEKQIFSQMKPNLSVQNLQTPTGTIREFTPDGKLMITISDKNRCVNVYKYNGIANVQSLVMNVEETDCIHSSDILHNSFLIRTCLFDKLFELKQCIEILSPSRFFEFLEEDFCLFVDQGRFALFSSQVSSTTRRSTPAVSLNSVDRLESSGTFDYFFYLVDLKEGIITDRIEINDDYFDLKSSACVAVYKRTLGFLLQRHQTIQIAAITYDNKILRVTQIEGYEDRTLFITTYPFFPPFAQVLPRELPIMKQKILIYLLRDSITGESYEEGVTNLPAFHQYFDLIEKMSLIEIKMLHDNAILVTFCTLSLREKENMVEMNRSDFVIMYVFYDLIEQKILNIQADKSFKINNKRCDYLETPNLYNGALSRLYHGNINLNDLTKELHDPIEHYLCKINSNFNMIEFRNDNLSYPYLNRTVYKYTFERTATVQESELIYQNSIICQNVNSADNKFTLKISDIPARFKTDNKHIKLIFHPYEPLIITTQRFWHFDNTNVHLYARMKKLN